MQNMVLNNNHHAQTHLAVAHLDWNQGDDSAWDIDMLLLKRSFHKRWWQPHSLQKLRKHPTTNSQSWVLEKGCIFVKSSCLSVATPFWMYLGKSYWFTSPDVPEMRRNFHYYSLPNMGEIRRSWHCDSFLIKRNVSEQHLWYVHHLWTNHLWNIIYTQEN